MSDQSKPDGVLEDRYGTPTLNEWKLYFRNMKQAPLAQREPTPESSEESSFELDESFRALLDRKRQQMRNEAREDQMHSDDEGEATPRENMDESSCYPNVVSGNDSTFLDHASISKVSNTSFEEMERMCAVLGEVSNLSVNDVAAGERQAEKPPTQASLTTFGDVTQLDDIDEPSGLWENTILPGCSQVLSPMKRVHLLRPSTIIEESTIHEAGGSKNSSIETYVSAQQTEGREVESRSSAVSGSEVYRTAEDTFATDSYARSSVMDSGLVYDSTTSDNQTEYEHREQYEEESAYSKNSTAEAGLTDVQNVIILDSSTSESENEDQRFQQRHVPKDPLDSTFSQKDDTYVIGNEQSSVPDDLEDSEDKEHNMSELEEMPDRFNDTLEETDYMLRQGMKLMAMKKKEELQLSMSVENEQQQKSRTNSESDDGATFIRHTAKTPADKGGLKATDTSNFSYLTPSGVMRSKLNVSHGTGSGCKQTLFSSAGKNNVTKKYLDLPSGGSASGGTFKRPVVSRLPQLKAGARKFDHIVSPIGAYIKKTPQSMLQTKITCPNRNLIEVLHSENRDSVLSSRGSKENYLGMTAGAGKGYTSSLPGKGVISSNRAHVLDERNLMRIPGGEKMQKLINGSPTMVIRHEGRIRYAGESGGAGRKLMMNDSSIGDDSLKDISIASNDVSVRVLHDAKRF
uniref:Septin interacting protein n=1 Tax=Anopheles atroparvus TaxID=41427 RepID=A0A182JF43_ANOAO